MRKIETVSNAIVFAVMIVFACSCGNRNQDSDPLGEYGDVYWGYASKATSALAKYVTPNLNFVWSTGSHTAQPVLISSVGPDKYTSRLEGVKNNSDISSVVNDALKEGIDVILVIGDGMGFSHLSLPVYYRFAVNSADLTGVEEWLNIGKMAISLTNPVGELVTCSAASGTAIANGKKTRNTMLGVDSSGYPLESSLEYAQKLGKATGLATDKHITDATPAAFYASAASRSEESDIASQLVENGNIDVVMGGGARMFIPESTAVSGHPLLSAIQNGKEMKSKRSDKRDLVTELQKKGYDIIATKVDLHKTNSPKIFGLFAGSNMNPVIDRDNEETGEPTLDAMASKAINILSDSKKGFFLMLESGRIDAEAHRNDAGALLKAMLETDKMLKCCLDYRKGREKKTLLILTADHETGGFGISYSYDSSPEQLTLPSGLVWKSPGNGVHLSNLVTLSKQDRSLDLIVDESVTAEELVANVGKYTPYAISLSDAKKVIKLK